MKLQVDERQVIPEQNLEDKIAYVAKITDVFACEHDGRRAVTTVAHAEAVRVQISNKSDISNGHSGQIYKPEDFKRFQEAYGASNPDDLMGKPVISVYTKAGPMLTGLIPLNMDR